MLFNLMRMERWHHSLAHYYGCHGISSSVAYTKNYFVRYGYLTHHRIHAVLMTQIIENVSRSESSCVE